MSPGKDPLKPQENVCLRPYNTLRIAAKSRYFIAPSTLNDLTQALRWAKAQHCPILVLGGGSNLVLTSDFPGLTLVIKTRGIQTLTEDAHHCHLVVQAGECWHDFVHSLLARSLHGLENLALIPGSVGAAPIQNIGAYGVEVGSFIHWVEGIDRHNGQSVRLQQAQCQFGYRDSIFKHHYQDRILITAVCFVLKKTFQPHLTYPGLQELANQSVTPHQLFDRVCALRQSKLPDPAKLGNVGSFFKNPLVDHATYQALKQDFPNLIAYPTPNGMKLAAGWLIEQIGGKQFTCQDAGVYHQQALVIVNHNQASGQQIMTLAQRIIDRVKAVFGICLQIEPRIYPSKTQ